MDEQVAISRLKQGDVNALETLVLRYQARAVHSAYLILRDRVLAEDVVQNAFVKAVERIHQFDEERPFGPWFYRIVVNDAVKLAKKQNRTVSLDEQLDEHVVQTAAWLRDPSLPPEQLIEQVELHTVILDAMQTLLPEQRAVIIMRYFLEMSEADMSDRMDRPLTTIKWWLREARKRLRDRMRASQFEESR